MGLATFQGLYCRVSQNAFRLVMRDSFPDPIEVRARSLTPSRYTRLDQHSFAASGAAGAGAPVARTLSPAGGQDARASWGREPKALLGLAGRETRTIASACSVAGLLCSMSMRMVGSAVRTACESIKCRFTLFRWGNMGRCRSASCSDIPSRRPEVDGNCRLFWRASRLIKGLKSCTETAACTQPPKITCGMSMRDFRVCQGGC
jgi:hypothetical protein